jgi:dipeptidyl aminopeptidase/acylaminoacyl peptidase
MDFHRAFQNSRNKTPSILKHSPLIGILIFVAVTGQFYAIEAQNSQHLEPSDQFEIERVGSPALSPNGEWIAYTLTKTSLEDESSETRVWMIQTAGGDPIPMTVSGASSGNPQWSPDGRFLSFTGARNGENNQVWTLDRRGGEARQLTSIKQGIQDYQWSPDGSRLLLTIQDPDPENGWGSDKDNAPQAPWVVDRLQFKRDGQGYLTGDQHTHLYIFDIKTHSLSQVTSGDYNESQATWSPDGQRIAFVSNRTAEPDGNQNTDIWIVSSKNTDKGQTLLQVTTNLGSDSSPSWSPDGEWITYVSVTEPDLIWYATNHLAIVSSTGGDATILTKEIDRNISSPKFQENGKYIIFRMEDSSEDHLVQISVDGGTPVRFIEGPLSVGQFSLGKNGTIATLIGTLNRPPEIHVLENNEVKRVTYTNDKFLDGIELADVKNVRFPSKDGTEIEGFVTFPIGFEEGIRYPTLLRIHGGPVSQYRHSFNFEAQLFAANGYVVVQTNPRGSSGYGQEFSADLWAEWGVRDYEDVVAGVDYTIERGWSDPDRLGVGGWSYGGILTDHVITQTDRFSGAITGASEFLYVANYGHDHYQLQWEKELGLPWEGDNRKAWEAISPFNKVDRITTPTLVMGGEKDWNVPIQNGEQIYQSLRRLGIPTELVVYPGQGHGLRPPSYQKDRHERYLAWYDKWVKNIRVPVSEKN